MPTFIETCNCRGSRPSGVTGPKLHSRPAIIGAMLKDRHVPRFIVAPDGFGKSSLVYEYASIMFAFQHVFWIKCSSPCFLRDLDAKTLLDQIIGSDRDVELIVCEDVPRLDDERCTLFNEFMDAVMDQGCEIIVTTVPSAQGFTARQFENIRITGTDLLLSDDEMAIEEVRGAIGVNWRTELSGPDRTACLRWSDSGAPLVLEGFCNEDIPHEMKLAVLVLLVCQFGQLDVLERFIPHEHIEETLRIFKGDYPFLGIDMQKKSHCSMRASVEDLSKWFRPHIEHWAHASLQGGRDGFCTALAGYLIESGAIGRAAEFMEEFATKQSSAIWLVRNGWRLMQCGNIMGCLRLYDACKRGGVSVRDKLSLIKGWLLYILGDVPQALRMAKRCMKAKPTHYADRMQALMLCLFCLSPQEGASVLAESIEEGTGAAEGIEAKAALVYNPVDWPLCATLISDCLQGKGERLSQAAEHAGFRGRGAVAASSVSEMQAGRNALLLACAYVFYAYSGSASADAGVTSSSSAASGGCNGLQDIAFNCARILKECIDSSDQPAAFDLFLYLALSALGKASTSASALAAYAGTRGVSDRINSDTARIAHQSDEYRRYKVKGVEEKIEYQRLHPDSFRKGNLNPSSPIVADRVVPTLHISLFGGLQASISSQPVDPKLISRKKAKAALALLVVNKGRELTRGQIADSLWPEEGMDGYTRNFYSIWSMLKKAFSVDGSCPYLIRSQSGCRIEIKYVTSDVFVFDDLCRKLMFGTDDTVIWEKLYAQVNEDFADDLLPSECENRQIVALRERYKNNLIDGLLATSARLNGIGEARGALWFAREAIRRDDKREDSYIALMEAQIAANQRGAALETYFACRRFLNEELGIDPSMKVVELYRSIIETVASFE